MIKKRKVLIRREKKMVKKNGLLLMLILNIKEVVMVVTEIRKIRRKMVYALFIY